MKKKSTLEELKKEGVVKAASELMPESKPMTFDEYMQVGIKGMEKYAQPSLSVQMTEIVEFCEKEGILPKDLIEAYKTKGKAKKVVKTEANEQPKGKPTKSNWRKDYIKSKTGYQP